LACKTSLGRPEVVALVLGLPSWLETYPRAWPVATRYGSSCAERAPLRQTHSAGARDSCGLLWTAFWDACPLPRWHAACSRYCSVLPPTQRRGKKRNGENLMATVSRIRQYSSAASSSLLVFQGLREGVHPRPTEDDLRQVAWLNERLVILHRERHGLWARLRQFLFGR
jgi:hypothetical protein